MIDWKSVWASWQNNERLAVTDEQQTFTYSEFADQVNIATAFLRRHDIHRIIIKTVQSFHSYALIWACYLSEVTFCPVSENTPQERFQYFLTIFKPDFVVEEIALASSPIFTHINDKPATFSVPTNPDHTAYVIFTSGSTGKPKGVKISRKGFENFLSWSTNEYGLVAGDVYGQYSSLGFDLSLMDIFTGLICGCTLIPFATPGAKLRPGIKIKKFGVNFWHSVPTVIDLLNHSGHLQTDFLQTLKVASFCGEKLFPAQLTKMFSVIPELIVYNTYGPTETTLFCTYEKVSRHDYLASSQESVSIGTAITGYQINLLSSDDGLGEIMISGPYIGQGYESEKEFSGGYLSSSYLTGDYAELIAEKLYFRGRKDAQVKINGNRIDLSEIDHQLRELGCMAAATVLVQNNLISFVIDPDNSEDMLRVGLAKFLPAYYLPVKIIFCGDFPYLASGKIDLVELKDRIINGKN